MLIGDLQVNNLFNQFLVTNLSSTLSANAGVSAGTNYVRINTPSTYGKTDVSVGNYWTGGRSFAASLGLKF